MDERNQLAPNSSKLLSATVFNISENMRAGLRPGKSEILSNFDPSALVNGTHASSYNSPSKKVSKTGDEPANQHGLLGKSDPRRRSVGVNIVRQEKDPLQLEDYNGRRRRSSLFGVNIDSSSKVEVSVLGNSFRSGSSISRSSSAGTLSINPESSDSQKGVDGDNKMNRQSRRYSAAQGTLLDISKDAANMLQHNLNTARSCNNSGTPMKTSHKSDTSSLTTHGDCYQPPELSQTQPDFISVGSKSPILSAVTKIPGLLPSLDIPPDYITDSSSLPASPSKLSPNRISSTKASKSTTTSANNSSAIKKLISSLAESPFLASPTWRADVRATGSDSDLQPIQSSVSKSSNSEGDESKSAINHFKPDGSKSTADTSQSVYLFHPGTIVGGKSKNTKDLDLADHSTLAEMESVDSSLSEKQIHDEDTSFSLTRSLLAWVGVTQEDRRTVEVSKTDLNMIAPSSF